MESMGYLLACLAVFQVIVAQDTAHRHIHGQDTAQATCTALGGTQFGGGSFSAVVRDCGKKETCNEICVNALPELLRTTRKIVTGYKSTCYRALHLYYPHGVNMAVHLFDKTTGCNNRECGPNFCCCNLHR